MRAGPIPSAMALLVFAVAYTGPKGAVRMEAQTEALLETDRAWAAAAAAGDVQKLTTFWAEDATNYFPGAPVARGREAIGELVRRNRSQPGFSLSWEPREAVVAPSGDLGYTTGTFTTSRTGAEGDPITRGGHYVCIWTRQRDGS